MYSGSFQNINESGNHTGSLSNLSSGSEGNLMRGPGSDLDLNALYKSNFNNGSLPNVPNTLGVPNHLTMHHSASNPNMAPMPTRMAPAPPPAFMPIGQPAGLAQLQPNAFGQNGAALFGTPMGVQNGAQVVLQNGVQNGVQNGIQNGMSNGLQNGVPANFIVQNPQMVNQSGPTSGFETNFQPNTVPEIKISEAPTQEIGKFVHP